MDMLNFDKKRYFCSNEWREASKAETNRVVAVRYQFENISRFFITKENGFILLTYANVRRCVNILAHVASIKNFIHKSLRMN